MSSNKSNYCAISRTVAVVVTAILLISSIISCNNPLSGTDSGDSPLNQKTGTVSGKLTFKGAIPQELIGKNTNSTSSKTAVPVFNMTDCEYVITAYDPMNDDPYSNITATFNDNHTEYTLKGIPLDSPCTVEVSVFADSGKTKKILTGKNTFTLTQESPIVSANIELNPCQTQNGKGTVNLAIKWEYTSVVPYIECNRYKFTKTDDNYYMTVNDDISPMQSGPKTVTVNFWTGNQSSKGALLYSFTETINIFDNLETNTWIKNADGTNCDPHLVLKNGETMIADCIITADMVNNFQSTTFYVDTTAGSSTETGTFSNPFTTLQAAVDHIIAYGNTTDKYTIYIKNDIDFDGTVEIFLFPSDAQNRNITVAGYESVKTIKRTIDSTVSLFTFKGPCNIFLRDLILDGNEKITLGSHGGAIYSSKTNSSITLENVTIQNFHIKASGGDISGGAIYSNSGVTLKNSSIINCICQNESSAAYGGAIYFYNSSSSLVLDDVVISGCQTQADAASKESYGGAIYNKGTCNINKAIITGCRTIANSGSPDYAKGGAIYNTVSLTLGDSICNSDGSPDVTIGIGSYNGEEYTTPNEAFNGAGVYSGESGTNASFTMNKDCVIGKYNPPSAPTEEIYGNRSCSTTKLGNGGAGVWISSYNKTMTINGGFISYNYAENTASDPGSAIPIRGVGLWYYGNDANPEIKNLVISYNKAYIAKSLYSAAQGVGFYFGQSVTLNNVKVENNIYDTASATPIKGKGLYSNPTSIITLKGTTYFGTDDDIYLDVDSNHVYNGKLKVNSTLNPQNTFGVPQQYVATITPGAYVTENAFLTGNKVGTEYKKFKVKTDSSGDKYGFDSSGKIVKKLPDTKSAGVTSFYITDEEDLLRFIKNWTIEDGETYTVVNDISLSDSASYSSKSISVNIVFDGNGKTISNLKMPIFDKINKSTAEIKNINARGNFTVNAGVTTGGIANTLGAGSIENCTFEGTITVCNYEEAGGHTYIGGIVGKFQDAVMRTSIKKCINKAQITAVNLYFNNAYDVYIGGIAGYANYGNISECKNTGEIEGSITVNRELQDVDKCNELFIGGITGFSYDSGIELCINYAKMYCLTEYESDFSSVGGISGVFSGSAGYNLENCGNKAEIIGTNSLVGGICGFGINAFNSYNIGNITCNNAGKAGGIIGGTEALRMKSCYNIGQISGNIENIGGITTNFDDLATAITYEYVKNCYYYKQSTWGTYSAISGCSDSGSITSLTYDGNVYKVGNTELYSKMNGNIDDSDMSSWKKAENGYAIFDWEEE